MLSVNSEKKFKMLEHAGSMALQCMRGNGEYFPGSWTHIPQVEVTLPLQERDPCSGNILWVDLSQPDNSDPHPLQERSQQSPSPFEKESPSQVTFSGMICHSSDPRLLGEEECSGNIL
jgi:hypothetical protein